MADGYILKKAAIQTYLMELKRILNDKKSTLIIMEREDKTKGYNISDCRAELGIDNEDIKKYIKNLNVEDYVETCDDKNNSKSNAYYIFGITINSKEIYIKVKIQSYNKKIIICMSFHFAEYKLEHPYK